MNIARAGAWSAIGTAARLGAALVTVKLVAWLAGPAGVGRLGQFMSLMSVLAVFAGGGINAGIVKYVAEYRDDPERLSRLLASALGYAIAASCVMGCVALPFSRPLASWLLGDPGYDSLIRVLALALIGIALVNYVLAVINGFMDVRRLAFIQVGGSILSVALALCLAHAFGLYGALLALVLGQLFWLLVGLPAWWRSPYFSTRMLRVRFDATMTRRLAAFSIMSLTSALLPPLVNIAVRDHLAASLGWEQVGYWQAVTRVSDAYLLFVTTAINVYYLPRLAATSDPGAIGQELRQAWRWLMPAVVAMALGIYLSRDAITRLLFSGGFAAANDLYAPQLAGDVVKIAAFVMSYLMLAKAMTRLYVVSECVFAVSYLALVYLCSARFGLIGAMYAFAINYLAYLAFNAIVVRRFLGGAAR